LNCTLLKIIHACRATLFDSFVIYSLFSICKIVRFPLSLGISTDVDSISIHLYWKPFLYSSIRTRNTTTDPPDFPQSIAILNCYLHEVLQFRCEQDQLGTTIGIAISAFSDAGILYNRMHLSTGAIFTINSGFMEILQQNEGDIHTSEEE
jgi:hypothetical protein